MNSFTQVIGVLSLDVCMSKVSKVNNLTCLRNHYNYTVQHSNLHNVEAGALCIILTFKIYNIISG
jgi:hypothetical protein